MVEQHGSHQLLAASQVGRTLQLPLAIMPLIRQTPDARQMRGWRMRGLPLVLAGLSDAFLVVLNGALLWPPLWQLGFGG
ncbi:hypothetical protein WN982_09765 [Paraburkholderia sp. IMGN_8]|uniref:hypothetical protein n=1 Tax=Paraburkholderia sp. IMGN_8 TaxID=3136564 RepID=UPI00310121AB